MTQFKFQRREGPLLTPNPGNRWESRAVFNPGTVRMGDWVHMLYRAVEGDNVSTIGYARLNCRGEVVERREEPVIDRELASERQGCEDARIVPFGDRYYIFYTAYDGADPLNSANTRVMMADTEDFQTFTKIGLVGPDIQDKDAFLFPGTVDGKVVYMHRIAPHIQVAVFESVEQFVNPGSTYWPEHLDRLDQYTVMRTEFSWESKKIGAGPPPLRTEAGWLLIYHGVDKNHVYRAGAALLDERNPYRVLARLPYPILEPEREYERFGDVNNVVFPEGLALFDDELQVYYGGADKVVALATGQLSRLIEALWKNRCK